MVLSYNPLFDDELDNDYEWLRKKSPKKNSVFFQEQLVNKKSLREKETKQKSSSPKKTTKQKSPKKQTLLSSPKKIKSIIFTEKNDDDFDSDYPWLKKKRIQEQPHVEKSPKKLSSNYFSGIRLEDYVNDYEHYEVSVPPIAAPIAAPPVVVPPIAAPIAAPPVVVPPIAAPIAAPPGVVPPIAAPIAAPPGVGVLRRVGTAASTALGTLGGALAATPRAAAGAATTLVKGTTGAIGALAGTVTSGVSGLFRRSRTPVPTAPTVPLPPPPPAVPQRLSIQIQPVVNQSLPRLSIKINTNTNTTLMGRLWSSFFPTRVTTTPITFSIIPIVNNSIPVINLITLPGDEPLPISSDFFINPVVNNQMTNVQIRLTEVPLPTEIIPLSIAPIVNNVMSALDILVTPIAAPVRAAVVISPPLTITPIVNNQMPNIDIDVTNFVERIPYTSFTDEITTSLPLKVYYFIMILFILLTAGVAWNNLPRTEVVTFLNIDEKTATIVNNTINETMLSPQNLIKDSDANNSVVVLFDKYQEQPHVDVNYLDFLKNSKETLYNAFEYLGINNILNLHQIKTAKEVSNDILFFDDTLGLVPYNLNNAAVNEKNNLDNEAADKNALVPSGYIFKTDKEIIALNKHLNIFQIALKIFIPAVMDDAKVAGAYLREYFAPYIAPLINRQKFLLSNKEEEGKVLSNKEENKVEEEGKVVEILEENKDVVEEKEADSENTVYYDAVEEAEVEATTLEKNNTTIPIPLEKKGNIIDETTASSMRFISDEQTFKDIKQSFEKDFPDIYFNPYSLDVDSLTEQLKEKLKKLPEATLYTQIKIENEKNKLNIYLDYLSTNTDKFKKINTFLETKNEEEFSKNQKEDTKSKEFFIIDKNIRAELNMELLLLQDAFIEKNDGKLLANNEIFGNLNHQIQTGKIIKKDGYINEIINLVKIGDDDMRNNYPNLLQYKSNFGLVGLFSFGYY